MADQPKNLKGTRTETNLANAYIAESCAVTRYQYFARTATKESYFQVANIFNETAANEWMHGKIFLSYLKEGAVVSAPIGVDEGVLADTLHNLKVAAEEELHEGVEMYRKSAAVAREEGFDDIAARFEAIATIEEHHRQRFETLAKRIEDGTMWKREKPIRWQCLVCGYIYEGTTPPEVCPACNHPYQHYEPEEKNY